MTENLSNMDHDEARLKVALTPGAISRPTQGDLRTVMCWSDEQEIVILDDDDNIMFSSIPFYVGRALEEWKEELDQKRINYMPMSKFSRAEWTYDEVWWFFRAWEKRHLRSCFASFFPEVVTEGYKVLAKARQPRKGDRIQVKEHRRQTRPSDYIYKFIFFDLLRFATMDFENSYDDMLYHDMAYNVKPFLFPESPVLEGTATYKQWVLEQEEKGEREKYEKLGARPKTKNNDLERDSDGEGR